MFYKVFNPENETKTFSIDGALFAIPGRDYVICDEAITLQLRAYWAGFEVVDASEEEKAEYDNKLKVVEKKSDDKKASDEKDKKKYEKPKKSKK